ncbi:MAG: hypothetical protein HIU81_12065 [Acidobacteria bacterium]|nr:hypothetical protein [Acidobacteriota bacterium]
MDLPLEKFWITNNTIFTALMNTHTTETLLKVVAQKGDSCQPILEPHLQSDGHQKEYDGYSRVAESKTLKVMHSA